MSFQELQLHPEILDATHKAGYDKATPIQKEAIPLVLAGGDLIAQASTGTGKTAAFSLPLLHKLMQDRNQTALILVPTRELAKQVAEVLTGFAKAIDLHVATVYGGASYEKQLQEIKRSRIIVATPGRLIDLLQSKRITLNADYVILDEADEMLDMGFLEPIKKIFTYLPKERQTMMFSATMPQAIRKLAKVILHKPKEVSIAQKTRTNANIDQSYYLLKENEKEEALLRLWHYLEPDKAILFCRTRRDADKLTTQLRAKGLRCAALHGDIAQRKREETIRAFKSGYTTLLIATDVAARGLDIDDVTHVFNYAIPDNSESYIHRIGRTGRGGKSGNAINLVAPQELQALYRIEKSTGAKITHSEVPHAGTIAKRQVQQAAQRIKALSRIADDADALIETLSADLDEREIMNRMASLLLEKGETFGAKRIGYTIDEARALLQKQKHRPDRKRSRYTKRTHGTRRYG